jgi:Trypsin
LIPSNFKALIQTYIVLFRKDAGLSPENAQVRAGSSFASSGGDVYRLELTLPHYLYDPEYSFHDVGIAKTTEPFRLSQTIRIAVVANKPSQIPEPGTNCTVVGYGRTRNPDWDRARLARLRYKNIPILDSEVCEKEYDFDRDTQLCAGSPTENMGSDHVG